MPKCWNHPSFINISHTVVIDTSMERSAWVLQHETHLCVSAVIFCKQCLAYTVQIDWCYHAIHKHSSRFQHVSVLIACTYMTTSGGGVHRRFFEGRNLYLLQVHLILVKIDLELVKLELVLLKLDLIIMKIKLVPVKLDLIIMKIEMIIVK